MFIDPLSRDFHFACPAFSQYTLNRLRLGHFFHPFHPAAQEGANRASSGQAKTMNCPPNACAVPPAVNSSLNASLGQIFGDMRVSSSATWITQNEAPEPGTLMMLIPALGLLRATRRLGTNR